MIGILFQTISFSKKNCFRIRGTLGSLLLVCTNIGTLMSFVAGAYIEYSLFPCIMIVFPLMFLIAFYFLPETPQYLLQLDKVEVSDPHIILLN